MLQLEGYFYPRIIIKADPKYKPSNGKRDVEIDIKSKFSLRSEQERTWQVIIFIKTIRNKGSIPYDIEIQSVGFFKVALDYPEDEMEKLVEIGGPSILYSAARDFILTITSRGPWGELLIPSITFIKQQEKKKDPGK